MSRAGSQVLCLLSILINMSIVVGTAIREVYKVKPADYKPTSVGGNVSCSKERGSEFPHASIQAGISTGEAALQDDHNAGRSMFLQLAEDEFYDVPEDSLWEREHEPDVDPNSPRQHSELEGSSDEDQVRDHFLDDNEGIFTILLGTIELSFDSIRLFDGSWSPMIFCWLFCKINNIFALVVHSRVLKSNLFWISEGQIHFKHQNEFDSQWADTECSSFKSAHYHQACTVNLPNIEGGVR